MKNIHRIIGLCFCFFSSIVLACSCAYSTLEERVAVSENIFIVETYKIETLEAADHENLVSGKRRAYFKVLDTLKGSSSGMEFINSAEEPICCMCQMKVENNKQYLVFTNGSDVINLSSCGFTQAVSNPAEIAETIRAMLLIYKPTEIFTGVFISDDQLFLNDDGTNTKVVQLRLTDHFARMSRISFEGLRLPTGKLMVTKLDKEQTLSKAEVKVLEEMLNQNSNLKRIN